MNALQIVAILLIVLGILGLAYGSFTYVKSTNTTKIGLSSCPCRTRKPSISLYGPASERLLRVP